MVLLEEIQEALKVLHQVSNGEWRMVVAFKSAMEEYIMCPAACCVAVSLHGGVKHFFGI